MNTEQFLSALQDVDDADLQAAGLAGGHFAANNPFTHHLPNPKLHSPAEAESARDREAVPILAEKRQRFGWRLAAAVLVLVLAAASTVLFLKLHRPSDTPGPSQAATPSGSSEPVTDSSDTVAISATELSPEPDSQTNPRHELPLDLDGLSAKANFPELPALCDYIRAQTTSRKNEMTGLFAGKNLILVAANCFSPALIDPDRTPTLYRMASQGIEFQEYYQPKWGGAESTGEFSILTGIAPVQGVNSMRDTIGKSMYLTLGNQLRRQGYFSRAYCNHHSYDYYDRHLTHENLGYDRYIGIGNGLEAGLTKQWPYSDREMIDFTLPQFLDQQPFSVYFMTSSGHGVYSWQSNAMSAKHRAEVEGLPCSETLKAYIAANLELEQAMTDLIAALEQAGIADDSVIVLSSTEYPYALEQDEDYGNFEDYLAELNGGPVENCFARDRSALLIWSGCLEGKAYLVTEPCSSLDLVPTLSNLFGLEYDSRLLVGRDVFSDQEPLVFWPDGSWKTEQYSYDAETRAYLLPDGTPSGGTGVPYEYAMEIHEAVEKKLWYSNLVLKEDLFALLFPEAS